MLTYNEERLEVTPKHFGQKLDPQTTKIPNRLYLLALGFIVLAFIVPLLRVIRDWFNSLTADEPFSTLGVSFIFFAIAIVLAFIGVKLDFADDEKRLTKLGKDIDRAYSIWYFTKLIPFLEEKYNVKFNEGSSNVFRDEGEWARTENGKMIKVIVGGVRNEHAPYDEWNGYRGHVDLVFTFSGDVWLSEVVSSRELDIQRLTPVER